MAIDRVSFRNGNKHVLEKFLAFKWVTPHEIARVSWEQLVSSLFCNNLVSTKTDSKLSLKPQSWGQHQQNVKIRKDENRSAWIFNRLQKLKAISDDLLTRLTCRDSETVVEQLTSKFNFNVLWKRQKQYLTYSKNKLFFITKHQNWNRTNVHVHLWSFITASHTQRI